MQCHAKPSHSKKELRLTLCPSENLNPLQSKRSRPPKMMISCELQLLWSTRLSQCITKKRLRGTASFLSASAILKKLFTTGEERFCHESIVNGLCIQRNALMRAVAPKPYTSCLHVYTEEDLQFDVSLRLARKVAGLKGWFQNSAECLNTS